MAEKSGRGDLCSASLQMGGDLEHRPAHGMPGRMSDPVLLWFRQDLRLGDQAALAAAVQEGPVIPLYVLDDQAPRQWKMGGASRWWLHHSLRSLDDDLRKIGRASCRERVCQYVSISVVAVSIKKKNIKNKCTCRPPHNKSYIE